MTERRSRRPSVTLRPASFRVEAERDRPDTSFTPILRHLWRQDPAIEHVVFVDHEGECVDYCTGEDPYEAQVTGAQLCITLALFSNFSDKIEGGRVSSFELRASKHDHLIRQIGDGYVLVVTVNGSIDQGLIADVEDAVEALRSEAGLPAPAWEPGERGLKVDVRPAVGWDYAPSGFSLEERRETIQAVLGRWEEVGALAQDRIVCFRVLTESGAEVTLAYDPEERRWMLW